MHYCCYSPAVSFKGTCRGGGADERMYEGGAGGGGGMRGSRSGFCLFYQVKEKWGGLWVGVCGRGGGGGGGGLGAAV